MIIISKGLILSNADAVDPNAGRIGYHSYITRTSVSADSAMDDFPISNVANPATAELWKSESLDEQFIYVVPGLNEGVDYIGLANHNFGSDGIAYRVEGSNDGMDWEVLSDEVIPNDDSPHVQLFELAVFQQYRIGLTPNGDHPPQAAIVYLGKVLGLQRKIYVGHTPITMGRSTTFSTKVSESGHFLGRIIRREMVESQIAINNLTPDWYRTYFEPFAEAARVTPFFWAWRPVSYPAEVGFVWATDDIVPSNQRPNGMMQVSFKVQGIGKYILRSRQVLGVPTT